MERRNRLWSGLVVNERLRMGALLMKNSGSFVLGHTKRKLEEYARYTSQTRLRIALCTPFLGVYLFRWFFC